MNCKNCQQTLFSRAEELHQLCGKCFPQVTKNTNPKLITRYYTQPHWSGNPESTHVEYNPLTKKYRFFNK